MQEWKEGGIMSPVNIILLPCCDMRGQMKVDLWANILRYLDYRVGYWLRISSGVPKPALLTPVAVECPAIVGLMIEGCGTVSL